MAKSYITTLPDLEDWFLALKNPYWTLYEGVQVQAGKTIFRQDATDDMSESWEILQSTLSRYLTTGGVFHIQVRKDEKSGTGFYTSIKLGGAQPAQVAGMNGFAGVGLYGISPDIEAKIRDDEREKLELRHEIEELKAAVNGKNGWIGELKDELLNNEHIAPVIAAVIAKFAGVGGGQMASVGQPSSDQHPPAEGDDEFFKVQNARTNAALEKISKRYSNYGDALAKLADFVEKNPEMADQFLKNQSA